MINQTIRRWFPITLSLVIMFILESALLPWLIPSQWRTELLIYPKLMLSGILYISMFANRRIGALYGFIFGLLQDVVFYGHMIGTNAFAYALSAYLAGLLVRPPKVTILPAVFVQIFALMLFELSSYSIYRLFNVFEAPIGWAFTHAILPSVLISLFLALAIYVPARKWLDFAETERNPDEE